MIENSRITLLQSMEKDPVLYSGEQLSATRNEGKQEEIVQKLILSNKKKFVTYKELNIPREVYQEIEEYGLDTLSIIKSVIAQFSDVLDQSSKGAISKN